MYDRALLTVYFSPQTHLLGKSDRGTFGFIAQAKTETYYAICSFDRQILFCKRVGTIEVNTIKHFLKRLWLVAIATILSKAFKMYFLFTSATAHN